MRYKWILPLLLCSVLLTGCIDEAPYRLESQTAANTEQTKASAVPTDPPSAAEPTETPTEHPTDPPTEVTPEPLILEGRTQLEVYERITAADFVTQTNAELTDPEMPIPTEEPGDFTVDIPCRRGAETQTVTLRYTVADTTPPAVLNDGSHAAVQTGQSFDLNSLVGYGDNYDRSPVLTYIGSVDTSTPGSYPVTATVTDAAGNAVSWDLTVTVADQLPKQDTRPTEDFADFAARYGTDGARCGIDVSKWQGNIDWSTVRDAGVSFVLIRCGYGDSSISGDEKFAQNIRGAAEAGLDTGVYFYSTAANADTARAQADWLAGQIADTGISLPVAFDWESFKTFQRFGMSLHDLNGIYSAFDAQMASYGYSTMLYSSREVLHAAWETEGRTIWLAAYADEPGYDGYTLWQQANTGRVPGISGDVDLDLLW